jgi:hypothetical protein
MNRHLLTTASFVIIIIIIIIVIMTTTTNSVFGLLRLQDENFVSRVAFATYIPPVDIDRATLGFDSIWCIV